MPSRCLSSGHGCRFPGRRMVASVVVTIWDRATDGFGATVLGFETTDGFRATDGFVRKLRNRPNSTIVLPHVTSFFTRDQSDPIISSRSYLAISNAFCRLSLNCAVFEISRGHICTSPPPGSAKVAQLPPAVRGVKIARGHNNHIRDAFCIEVVSITSE